MLILKYIKIAMDNICLFVFGGLSTIIVPSIILCMVNMPIIGLLWGIFSILSLTILSLMSIFTDEV